MADYEIVDTDKEFVFKERCPYCGGDLAYKATAWEETDDGHWIATTLESACLTMPDVESEEWKDWAEQHTYMPYVYQLPVDVEIEREINSKYRFNVDES